MRLYTVVVYVVEEQPSRQDTRDQGLISWGLRVVSRPPANQEPPLGRNHAASDRLPMT